MDMDIYRTQGLRPATFLTFTRKIEVETRGFNLYVVGSKRDLLCFISMLSANELSSSL